MLKVAMAMAVAAMLTGCSSPPVVVTPPITVSVGQQLIDLKKARDSGALTEREYQDQKAQFIRNVD